jgi:hypothetical protein
MRERCLRRKSRSHRSKPLVVRGGLTRTFGGLASFLAVLFLGGGLYILNDTLSNPVEAQAAAMIAGRPSCSSICQSPHRVSARRPFITGAACGPPRSAWLFEMLP